MEEILYKSEKSQYIYKYVNMISKEKKFSNTYVTKEKWYHVYLSKINIKDDYLFGMYSRIISV